MYDNIAVHQKVMSRSAFNMTMGATTPPTINDRFENMIISPERVLEMLGRGQVGREIGRAQGGERVFGGGVMKGVGGVG